MAKAKAEASAEKNYEEYQPTGDASYDAKRKGRKYLKPPKPPKGNEKSTHEIRLEQAARDANKVDAVKDTIELVTAALEDVPNDPVSKRAVYDAVVKALKA